MKVQIQDYEVNISARYKYHKKATKKDTMVLLNWITICINSAAERQTQLSCYATAEDMEKAADLLFKQLMEKGLYNFKERTRQ